VRATSQGHLVDHQGAPDDLDRSGELAAVWRIYAERLASLGRPPGSEGEWARAIASRGVTVYVITDIDVSDPELYAQYQAGFPAVAAKHGGRYLVRGGDFITTGEWGEPIKRLVMLEFPSREDFEATMADPDYEPLIPIRNASSKARTIVVDAADTSYDLPRP
jgi:uncharacterized protein (DUF1330 family)